MSGAASESAWEVREAHLHDAGAVARVHARSWLTTYADLLSSEAVAAVDVPAWAQLWRERIAGLRSRVLVAVGPTGEAGEAAVVGFAFVAPDEDVDARGAGQVRSLHVDPDRRRRGIGTDLLARACTALVDLRFATATLWVVASNAPARRRYERAGWHHDGASRQATLAVLGTIGPSVPLVRYRRDLPDRPDGR